MSTNVLVVDGTSKTRTETIQMLKQIGMSNFGEASKGNEAVDLYKQNSYDLVLINQDMPDTKGIEVVRQIRELDTQVPIIVTSTSSDQTISSQATQVGASDYIVRPYTMEMIREKIDQCMSATISQW